MLGNHPKPPMQTILTCAAVLVVLALLRRWTQQRLPLPPGPKGRFLVGNVFDLPKHNAWRTYAKWAKMYDPDIFYLNLAGKNLIVLNTMSAAEELLERRSAIYSSRPDLPMATELMGWDFALVLMKYGPKWRQHRKFMSRSLTPAAVERFKPHMTKATHQLMRNLLAKPEDYKYLIRHMTAEVILLFAYGLQILPENDPHVSYAERAMASLNDSTLPGRFLVDVFPWLKYVPEWMPFAGFQKQAKEWKKLAIGMVENPYRAVKDDILAGKGINSMVADGLRAVGDDVELSEWENVVKNSAGMVYAGGSDTSVAAITLGLLGLICYPEVLKKAQAEIDTVVKPGNLPEFDDIESLPYLSALIKEMWRWNSAVPMGCPHVLEKDDVYKGYRIPANTMVLPNAWAMLHNEDIYSEPSTFNPDRFMKDGKINPEIQDPERVIFGFGRRICPGSHFAIVSMKMTMASIIALFDISMPIDENGNKIEPRMEFTNLTVSHPAPFKCKIVPRSEAAAEAIKRTEGYDYIYE